MNTPISEDQLLRIQEEIQKRVFETYSQKQGIETQWTEIEATLEALHEVTKLPMEEIQKIAEQVTQEHATKKEPLTEAVSMAKNAIVGTSTRSVDELDHRVQQQRRKFMPHLVSFASVNSMLIILNVITSPGFPWAMFPLFGWGIGLVIQFFSQVYYPARDVNRKRSTLQAETHQILSENISAYSTHQEKVFNGTYRMLLSETTLDELKNFLQNLDASIDPETAYQTSLQLIKLKETVLPENEYDFESKKGRNSHPKGIR